MPRVSNDERHPTQEQAEKARTQAGEVVELLEQGPVKRWPKTTPRSVLWSICRKRSERPRSGQQP